MIACIQAEYCNVYGLLVYADLPSFGRDKPRPVAGYIPDVFAVDAPETVRILGEAKTPIDFESERSCRQIKAFLLHLARVQNGAFYLSVPSSYRARASGLIAGWANEVGAGHVRRVLAAPMAAG